MAAREGRRGNGLSDDGQTAFIYLKCKNGIHP